MNRQPSNLALEADANRQQVITDEQARFFLDNGFLVIRNVLRGKELRLLQEQTLQMVEKGLAGQTDDRDYLYRIRANGEKVYWRTEYVIDKSEAAKVLLGHPFILHTVDKLQGPHFIPTWDSLVVKAPNNAAAVPWHRDALLPEGCKDPRPIFNVDFYLDDADESSCLWVIPGSQHWESAEADERCSRPGFTTGDAVPVPMKAGDVILHNIQLLHGSPEGEGNALRRTVYYEFRPGEIETAYGPHTLEYLPIKQRILLDCINRRRQSGYTEEEQAFEYRPTGAFAPSREDEAPASYRIPHESYWRK
ncbi:phytanoyl-CoA dioxygenase family protein [Paenibacillus glycanilyticus]|uniref:phytanoyl-CoA dioxygenase family protein n=1 Tax=Paenibacillus glycanilyticus TaxID=126569 RepID=UPI00204187D8|nr:phytanoyl-CoA dioxygenase family protein [Paenibacillus glycanilyticus]MCM3626086.1 phytanoyl-CoA dioxygenase family protein [Paenibacillus glycanilyticus]